MSPSSCPHTTCGCVDVGDVCVPVTSFPHYYTSRSSEGSSLVHISHTAILYVVHSETMISFIPSVLLTSLLILYLSSCVHGNTIKSTDQSLSVEIGETITLSCNYSTISNNIYLYWYRQYPHQIQYILVHGAKGYSYFKNNNTELESGKFQSETSDTHTTLTIHDLSVSDSAVYLCALSDGAQCYITAQEQC
ncbi:hypothetical protein AB205_0071260 [Aquarana catesbeiana]|uniref:Ig-like domain-containing protein n=1 Tax=Aquarana catesbeiana TaxID=8400 RepID=A0A2G9QLQ0_AQUCT|nr:hypothetical protein AB205_0071260 [Aquarana catesbeiana]